VKKKTEKDIIKKKIGKKKKNIDIKIMIKKKIENIKKKVNTINLEVDHRINIRKRLKFKNNKFLKKLLKRILKK
jgi:hypothetical protein